MSGDREHGSVLMLMPAAVLVLMMLGAVAVDAAVVFMAQRELENATAAAANDAAVAALDESLFYECGELGIDTTRAAEVASAALAARTADAVEVTGAPAVTVQALSEGPLTVSVAATGSVRTIFAPAVGGLRDEEVTAVTRVAAALAPDAAPEGVC